MESYAHAAMRAAERELDWGEVTSEEAPLVALYALLTLVKGEEVTPSDVHDAWAIWAAMGYERPDHWSLVPFDQLAPESAAKDAPYVEAIRRAAQNA